MYEDCQTQVTTREGNTDYFDVKVGLHQGSAIDTESPWAMLVADDLILCETSKAAVERERTGDMARPFRKTWTEIQPDKNRVHAMQ